ncbi:hypothetical protein EDB85DRAFT_1620464 [Lactarius pseudohatsudake]|nr:hypothetical protein EDB85DRAFT_1620464 [Lactarius pseudohatsudake]
MSHHWNAPSTSPAERRFRVTYHGPTCFFLDRAFVVRDQVCTVLPLCPACQHPRRGNRSICVCVLFTHVLYMNVEGTEFVSRSPPLSTGMSASHEAQSDVGCVFGPFSPYYVTRHPPRRPVNPSIHRHGRVSRRAFVLSTWSIDDRIRGLYITYMRF